jgi:predicted secreted acid phosphatase
MRKSIRVASIAAACAVAGAALYGTGAASAHTSGTKTHEPINMATLVSQIDTYYGGTKNSAGVWSASPDSLYAADVEHIESDAEKDIKKAVKKAAKTGEKPAIVLDIDDTSLQSYDFEKATNFTYSSSGWEAYIKGTTRQAVFGMPELVAYAKSKGVEVFFLSGLAESLRSYTVANLDTVGYKTALDTGHVFLKDKVNPPSYLSSCATAASWTCTTVQYKEGTRKYIESEGYNIIGSFGDQQSDLDGGYADKTYKIPNPTYFVA